MKSLAANPQMFADLESPFGAMALDIMASMFPRDVAVTRVTQTGDTAIVEIEGPSLKGPGKIPTVLVKGVWKLAEKEGASAPEAAAQTTASATEGTSTPEAAQPSATEGIGTLTVGEKTIILRHAYAFREASIAISGKQDVRIVLSDVPITFVEQGDGSFVPEEEAGWRNRVEVTFDPEAKTQRFEVIYHGGPDDAGIDIGGSEFAPTAFDDKRIAGKLSMYWPPVIINGVKVHYTASFDAAIQRASRPLTTTVRGAGSAESGPGKVVLAISKALWAMDHAALTPHLSENWLMMHGDDVLMFDFLVPGLMAEHVTITKVTET
ncbi:MAG: hypothetical protein ACRD2Y_09440, partial [Terriglobales bacterium]